VPVNVERIAVTRPRVSSAVRIWDERQADHDADDVGRAEHRQTYGTGRSIRQRW
jgi:hypothetical protein